MHKKHAKNRTTAPELKGYILRALGVLLLLCLLTAVPLVNYYGDASGMYHLENEKGGPAHIVQALQAGSNVENIGNYDERLVRRIYINTMEPKQTLVLGSSRAAMVTAQSMGKTYEFLFSCGVAAGSIYDVIGFYGALWQQDKLPQELIIVMDPWMLNDSYSKNENRWKAVVGDGYYAYLTQRMGIDCDPALKQVHPLADTDPSNDRTTLGNMGSELFLNLFSASYFQSSLQTITKNGLGATWWEITDHYGVHGTLRADGSFCYPLSYRDSTAQQKLTLASQSIGNIIGLEDYQDTDTADKELFTAFLEEVQKDGVAVTLVMFPLSNILYDEMAADPRHYSGFFEADELMRSIAATTGCNIVGTYDPYALWLEHTDFYDGYHPTDFVVNKIMEEAMEVGA